MIKPGQSFAFGFIFILTCGSVVHAASVGLDYETSSSYHSTTITADGDFDKEHDWNLSLGKSQTTSTNSTTGSAIIDNTTSIGVGLGVDTPSNLSYSGDFNFSNTPEESLYDIGFKLGVGYSYLFGSQEDEFRQKLKLDISVESTNYVEKLDRPPRPGGSGSGQRGSGNISMSQKVLGLGVSYKMIPWLRVKAKYKNYDYSIDVVRFVAFMDSLPQGPTNLGNVAASFPKNRYEIEIDFYFLSTWEADLSYSVTRLAADNSEYKTARAMLYEELSEAWKIGLGMQESTSSSSGSWSDSSRETDLSLEYSF